MIDEDEIRKKFRVWYAESSFSIYSWRVQRRTWYGRWKTMGKFYTEYEALNVKKSLIREEIETTKHKNLEVIDNG